MGDDRRTDAVVGAVGYDLPPLARPRNSPASNPQSPVPNPASSRCGMTFIEMLIVLGLMAALASVALTTLDEMGDRDRVDTSRHRLDMIEQAIVGDGAAPGRFLSDMGRLPVIHATSSDPTPVPQPGTALVELWDSGRGWLTAPVYLPENRNGGGRFFFNGFAAASTEPAWWSTQPDNLDPDGLVSRFPPTPSPGTGDPTESVIVDVAGGWRGPYLQVSGAGLYDGFGNPFAVTRLPAPTLPSAFVDDTEWYPVNGNTVPNPDSNFAEITGVATWGRDAEDDCVASGTLPEWQNADDARLLADSRVKATLVVSIRVRSNMPGATGWFPATAAMSITDWSVGRPHNAIVRATNLGGGAEPEVKEDDLFVYLNTTGEVSVENPPAWKRTTIEPDGTGNWLYLPSCEAMNRMRVVLFAPFADPDPTSNPPLRTREIVAWYGSLTVDSEQKCADSEQDFFGDPETDTGPRTVKSTWSQIDSVTLENVPPGIRQLYVYGYYLVGSNVTNAHASGLQTIEIKPGVNHVTVYLSEPLE